MLSNCSSKSSAGGHAASPGTVCSLLEEGPRVGQASGLGGEVGSLNLGGSVGGQEDIDAVQLAGDAASQGSCLWHPGQGERVEQVHKRAATGGA